jgi:hypothetical protein
MDPQSVINELERTAWDFLYNIEIFLRQYKGEEYRNPKLKSIMTELRTVKTKIKNTVKEIVNGGF